MVEESQRSGAAGGGLQLLCKWRDARRAIKLCVMWRCGRILFTRREGSKKLQQPDDVRAALVKEIRRREQQLAGLREALAQLDAALEAAAKAHAASVAAMERSLAAEAAAVAQTVRSGMHAVAVAPPREYTLAEPVAAAPKPEPVQTAPQAAPVVTHTPVAAPVANTHVPHRPTSAGRYANMKVWRAVQEMLTEHRKSMTMEEIVEKLQQGGASLGDSPVRTVSTAVGYMNDKIFHVAKSGGETYVNLLRPADY